MLDRDVWEFTTLGDEAGKVKFDRGSLQASITHTIVNVCETQKLPSFFRFD